MRRFIWRKVAAGSILAVSIANVADACTRAVCPGPDQRVLTGRQHGLEAADSQHPPGLSTRDRINAVPQSADARFAAAAVSSVIRQAPVPWGIGIADQPNLSTTRWRVVAKQLDRRHHVESVTSPGVFWVDLSNLDLSDGADVKKLDLGLDMDRILTGETSAGFEPATRFTFQPAD